MFLDSVDEFDSSKKVGDVVMSAEFSPSLCSTLSQLEHHRQAGLRTTVALRLAVSQTGRGECTFVRICRAKVTPVLSREVEEGQQQVSVCCQAFDALFVLRWCLNRLAR